MEEMFNAMNAADLVAPESVIPLPAPVWLMLAIKVLGFALHVVPMSLWLAGLPIALLMLRSKSEDTRVPARRLIRFLPIILALGINFGIVPLLFAQALYHRVFFPMTILMAWPWLSIIGLLCIAYYAIYHLADRAKTEPPSLGGRQQALGWLVVVMFVAIGYLFTVAFQGMAMVEDWKGLFLSHQSGGAVDGMALDHGNPLYLVRYVMFFGLAMTCVAAWMVFDAGVIAAGDGGSWRAAVPKLALRIFLVGLTIFGALGALYTFVVMPERGREVLFAGPMLIITALTALSPLAVLGLLWNAQRQTPSAATGWVILLAQFVVVLLNAISRQVVQAAEIKPYVDLAEANVRTQFSPLLLFLVLFVAGMGFICWMIVTCVKDVKGKA